jgi:acyl-coenzyme A synthetase/AMP-(fatty) acid ligase
MIKVSGALVSPEEVEQVISQHPMVSEVAVVGKPDPERGQIVKGFIVPIKKLSQEEMERVKEEIIKLAKEKLPSYKVPREIAFIEALPKTTSGKPIRRELLKMA